MQAWDRMIHKLSDIDITNVTKSESFCELPKFICCHAIMDIAVDGALSHFDPDLLNCTYS